MDFTPDESTADLTTLTAELADEDCLQRQARQDAAEAGGTVATFAGGLDASEFTATLRSLTALLLHLAAATRTPHELDRTRFRGQSDGW